MTEKCTSISLAICTGIKVSKNRCQLKLPWLLMLFACSALVSFAATNSTNKVVAITNIPDGKVIERKDVAEAYVKKGRTPAEAVNTIANSHPRSVSAARTTNIGQRFRGEGMKPSDSPDSSITLGYRSLRSAPAYEQHPGGSGRVRISVNSGVWLRHRAADRITTACSKFIGSIVVSLNP